MSGFLMDGHKLYWHMDRVLAWQRGELIAPIYVEISPISVCNHRCIFCGLDFAHGEQLSLDTQVLSARLREMATLGVKSIMFAGEGEPLLHKDLPRLIATAAEHGIDASITTNGAVATPEIWRAILPHLSWVRVSADAGSAPIHARVHDVAETEFAKVVRGLKDAIRIRRETGSTVTIGVQFLLLKENITDVEEAIRLYSDLGVDYISFKPYSEHPQMLNKTGFTYSTEMLDAVEAVVEKYRGTTATQLIFRKAALTAYMDGDKKFNCCQALPFWGYISSKGEFHTCSVFLNDDRFSVGNINEESMAAILFGEKRRQSVEYGKHGLAVGEDCRLNCRMARINEFLCFLSDKPQHINFI